MKAMRTLSHCVYRDKSASTGQLVAAVCKATLEFQPLVYDETGPDEDGREYRYASLAAINRATKPALCKYELYLHTDYGFDEEGMYATAVLEHSTGEFIASFIRVPHYQSIHRKKAAMTLMRRAAIEGLLGLAAEHDSDGPPVESDEPLIEVNPKWAENDLLACQAIAETATEEKVIEVWTRWRQKIERGFMNPGSLPRLNQLADARREELTKEMEVVS